MVDRHSGAGINLGRGAQAMTGVEYADPRLPSRFWEKVYPCPLTGCWLWGAATNRSRGNQQYAAYRHDGRRQYGHRVSFSVLVADVPAGMELDHLCRQTTCVNPDHLEVVTGRVNRLRGTGWVAVNAAKTHCPVGHAYVDGNTVISRGTRECRLCRNARKRAVYRGRKRGAR